MDHLDEELADVTASGPAAVPAPKLPNKFIIGTKKILDKISEVEVIASLSVIMDVLTSIATVVLAVYTILLWRATDEIRKFAMEQTQVMGSQLTIAIDAIKAANRQAKAAEEANAITVTNLKRQLRPVISFSGTEIATIYDKKKKTYTFDVNIITENSNQTPAYEVMERYATTLVGAEEIETFTMHDNPDGDPPKFVIGGGKEHRAKVLPHLTINENGMRALTAGKVYFLVYSKFIFKDAFGDSHQAESCYYYKDQSFSAYHPCYRYNYSD